MAPILKSSLPYTGPTTENTIELIRQGLQKHTDRTLLVDFDTGKSWSGEQLKLVIGNISYFLIEQCGLQKGDVCEIYGEETDRVGILILAVICAGGVCNFLVTSSPGRDVHDTAVAMGAKFIISRRELLQKIAPDISGIQTSVKVICYDEPCCDLAESSLHHLFLVDKPKSDLVWDELIAKASIEPQKDYAVIQFSSGTTGKPKPIPRTHQNLCHLVASVDYEELMDLKPGVVLGGILAMTHRPGLWALLAAVHCGNTFVTRCTADDVEGALAAVTKFKINILSSSLPFLMILCNTGIVIKQRYDLSSLEHIITSGAKILSTEPPAAVAEAFKLKTLRQCFGMTESGWVFLIEKSLAKDNYMTVGHVVPGMEVVILDRATNKPLGVGERGEIALRGPQVFPGYFTDEPGVLNRSDFTDDGWFKIGDEGYYDEAGLVFVCGRYKEVMTLITNGKWFPNEIEAIVSEHPAVEDACVVKCGQKEKLGVDIARAFVTLNHNTKVGEQELAEYVSSKHPTIVLEGGVRILEKFPRLQNGKVDKKYLEKVV